MAYDVASYEPGQGYDANPDTGANPGGEQPPAPTGDSEPATPAPASTPAPQSSGRYDHLKKAAAKQQDEPPAEEQAEEQQQEEQPQAETVPHDLKVPEFVSAKEITPERESFVSGFAQIAPQAGIDAPMAQNLLDLAVDAATALPYQALDADADPEDARAAMYQLFGEENGKNLIQRAQLYTRARGDAFASWLDETGLGSDPAVLVSLAFAHANYFSFTPAQAQEQISKITTSPEYQRGGDPLSTIKLHVLSRLVAKEAPSQEQQLAAAAKEMQAKRAAAAPAAAAPAAAQDARAELAALMKQDSLLNAGHPDHASAVKRFHQLASKI